MSLSISFLRDGFRSINVNHFGGELVEPKFEISHVRSYLGQYRYCYSRGRLVESVISISDLFDRSDDEIMNTLAHECIHLYIRQKGLVDTRRHHGRIFYSIADRLNREGGFHISRTDSVRGCGLRSGSNVEYNIGCFRSGRCGRYFIFCMNSRYLYEYARMFRSNPEHYRDAFMFRSSDGTLFAHLPKCHGGVRGNYISREEYIRYRDEYSRIVLD